MTYMEELICSTKNIHESEGEMMWIKEWLEFAQSTKGGKMSDEEASMQWQQWKSEILKDDSEHYHDQKGPKGFELRIWCKTRDKISFTEEYARTKNMEMREKEVKKARQEEIDQTAKRFFLNHGTTGRASSLPSLKEVARNMIAGSNNEAT